MFDLENPDFLQFLRDNGFIRVGPDDLGTGVAPNTSSLTPTLRTAGGLPNSVNTVGPEVPRPQLPLIPSLDSRGLAP